MFSSVTDHLVVTAPSLETGATFIYKTLGADMQPGGKHPRMGTHNLLLSLGDSLYLEVIAVDPVASVPDRPRWFGLDDFTGNDRPGLSTWVARTTDIQAATTACREVLGEVATMSRGQLTWQITIPHDGKPPLGGLAPALIEWPQGVHPASALKDHGLRLVDLQLVHPDPERIKQMLTSINFSGLVSVSSVSDERSSQLVATIATPSGIRLLTF